MPSSPVLAARQQAYAELNRDGLKSLCISLPIGVLAAHFWYFRVHQPHPSPYHQDHFLFTLLAVGIAYALGQGLKVFLRNHLTYPRIGYVAVQVPRQPAPDLPLASRALYLIFDTGKYVVLALVLVIPGFPGVPLMLGCVYVLDSFATDPKNWARHSLFVALVLVVAFHLIPPTRLDLFLTALAAILLLDGGFHLQQFLRQSVVLETHSP